jgi:xanthine dehydrogenase molybdenum-binding subunit
MLFAKLLLSPMPHCRVRRIDASAALAMEGVFGILTADDVPAVDAPGEACLTNEPCYEGEPILAVAAVDETTAADAIEAIKIDLEPLPFVLNPLDSLKPNDQVDGGRLCQRP